MAKIIMKSEAIKKGAEFLKTLKDTSFHISRLTLNGDGKKPLQATFFSEGEEISEDGRFFVKLPESVAHTLPGSYIRPETFIDSFPVREVQKDEKKKLLGNHMGKEYDLAFTSQENNFSLRVFHGSTNQYAMKISHFAGLGAEKPENRMHYQDNLSHILEPLLKFQTDAPLRIVEDCLASGDTLVGVIKTLAEKSKLNKDLGKVTIDVAVATAQGVFLLKKFAQGNGINIELNVGYLAFGLSQGIKRDIGYEHANYITYPNELITELTKLFSEKKKEILTLKGKQVVGDMGEFSKLIPERGKDNVPIITPWNKYRSDDHGGQNGNDFYHPKYNEQENQHLLYLSNGGYLMRALYHYLNNRDKEIVFSEIVFSAKRRWTKEFGYGVLLKDLPKEIVL
ncbi:MAG: hypothetical protein V1803_00085 [Candidatus Roizmanbacteria bacterium]